MNAAEYITNVLRENGIEYVFGYQGGNITYVIDAISRTDDISYVQTYQEQGAAFAANAYAQVSGKFGVAVSSSGPGAINMINGVANAYYDSIPCLFITGNINTASMRESEKIRQNGFQEADIVSMVSGITKYAVTVYRAEEIPQILDKALYEMRSGRSGPVLLDIPHNIQRTEITDTGMLDKPAYGEVQEIEEKQLHLIVEKLRASQKPVLLLGNGSRGKTSGKLIEDLLERVSIPTVVSLCGKDAISNMHPCYRGMIGSYGLLYSNRVLNEADFVLALGSRMDERQRTVGADEFLSHAQVVHVDIDENELGHVRKDEIKVNITVERFLEKLLSCLEEQYSFDKWLETTKGWMSDPVPEESWIYGSAVKDRLIQVLGEVLENSVVCVDVGNHQMAAAQALNIGKNSAYLNSAGLGSMGYALPAALGAYYAAKEKRIICIAGDGGLMMNLQELQVIARERIPIMIVVINNHGLGMIENYQNLAFAGRLYGSRWGYMAADFERISAAFGIQYVKGNLTEKSKLLNDNQPVLIEIEV